MGYVWLAKLHVGGESDLRSSSLVPLSSIICVLVIMDDWLEDLNHVSEVPVGEPGDFRDLLALRGVHEGRRTSDNLNFNIFRTWIILNHYLTRNLDFYSSSNHFHPRHATWRVIHIPFWCHFSFRPFKPVRPQIAIVILKAGAMELPLRPWRGRHPKVLSA